MYRAVSAGQPSGPTAQPAEDQHLTVLSSYQTAQLVWSNFDDLIRDCLDTLSIDDIAALDCPLLPELDPPKPEPAITLNLDHALLAPFDYDDSAPDALKHCG